MARCTIVARTSPAARLFTTGRISTEVVSHTVDSTALEVESSVVELIAVEFSTTLRLLPGPSAAIAMRLGATLSHTVRLECAPEPSATSIMAERRGVSRHVEVRASAADFVVAVAAKHAAAGIDKRSV
jgi:hypothetical protein